MQKKWWHGKIAYQIYPKSFMDSNGDGVGDIEGIIQKLPYLHDLGVEIVWISPIYLSPMVDQGYDISDYEKIDPVFGTDESFDRLIAQAKSLNIDIIMDLVVNHCSSEHPWFKAALADKNSKYRDYFYFREGKADGTPPDNLRSYFGGSVWEKVEGEENTYYLHYFAKEQPDLNWYNKEVREEIYAMMNRWFDRGISGFRIDAIMNIEKDLNFPSMPANSDDGLCSCNLMVNSNIKKIGHFLMEMKERTFDRQDKFSIGEAFGVPIELYKEFIGDEGCFSTMFDFKPRELRERVVNVFEKTYVTFTQFRDTTFRSQVAAQECGFLAPVMENHDEPRGVSYYIPKKWENDQGARAFATFLMLLRGIPFVFQGQELGLINQRFDSIDEIDDIYTKDMYKKLIAHGFGQEESLAICGHETRDNGRFPMPWDDSEGTGFTTGTPWLKRYAHADTLNVKAQLSDEDSTLNFYKKLIALRKDDEFFEIMTYGNIEPVPSKDLTAIYRRRLDRSYVTVAVNFSDEPMELSLRKQARVLLCSKNDALSLDNGRLMLASGCAAVFFSENA